MLSHKKGLIQKEVSLKEKLSWESLCTEEILPQYGILSEGVYLMALLIPPLFIQRKGRSVEGSRWKLQELMPVS